MATEEIAELETGMAETVEKIDKLKEARDTYLIGKMEAGATLANDTWQLTKVVAYRRTWDVSKLEKIVPKGILKNITELKVIPEKIDQYVKSGDLTLKKIAPAYTETPNKPYVRVSKVAAANGETEAAKLAEKLG